MASRAEVGSCASTASKIASWSPAIRAQKPAGASQSRTWSYTISKTGRLSISTIGLPVARTSAEWNILLYPMASARPVCRRSNNVALSSCSCCSDRRCAASPAAGTSSRSRASAIWPIVRLWAWASSRRLASR